MPCPMHIRKAMRDLLLMEYDATGAGRHQHVDHVGSHLQIAYTSVFGMVVDSEVERHELFARNDEERTNLK